ncbi:MAG: TIGR02391 family protein [Brevundimonas sp.]|uniref:TIGR02391 family protein n=1 Tax=Brevundimonas sp. TaxID=1871086 RepID=UPI002734A76A|nr:TIGR02391 family protein [Brevundimonas sp.]MDP3405886.1 TIGR02391 family protein [Brevundimonas sp.]
MDKIQELRQAYGWLKGFIPSIPPNSINALFVSDYGRIHLAVERALDKTLGDFSPQTIRTWQNGNTNYCDSDQVKSKAMQLLGFLEYGYGVEERKLEVESLFKAIHDSELQERCGDLIIGSGPFDRVINQATLVLEARIRSRAGLDRTLVGPNLVNAAIKAEPADSLIVFSDIRSEQEGYANIIRGLMQALRNETHHTLVDDFSREDALSICGFIDRILRLIDRSVIRR